MDRGGLRGPYLSEQNTGCYNHAPLVPIDSGAEQHNPCCTHGGTIDCCGNNNRETYLDMFKERWSTLRSTEPCQLKTEAFNPCGLDPTAYFSTAASKTQLRLRNPELCGSPPWDRKESLYTKDYKFPKSHNAIDDCCPAECPCLEKFPELPANINYVCQSPETCPPLDECTTYRHFYIPHDIKPRYRYVPRPYDPCECPLQECTVTKSDYTKKEPIINGPACAQIIRHGLWSTTQMCKNFSDSTTNGDQYAKKSAEKRCPFLPQHNLYIPNCPFSQESMTGADFPAKNGEDVCYPEWISNDEYYKPETELESCTTYKHYYKPYPIPVPLQSTKVGAPDAIPFCTINQLCYSCHDPKPQQKTPVEMRDQDPWPYVKPAPIKYQDNLQVDPCAEFCDITMYKSNFYPKTLCRRTESYKPILGYTEPKTPFNDNTTQKVSYPAYNKCEYDYAFGNAGNPNGINWGPFYCRENVDKCMPRFPAPFGHPLKPFLDPQSRCACGPFDNRSTYNQDFRFRSPEVLAEMERDMCQEPNVPKGISLSRFDYVEQGGKKAEIEKPPISKASRCLNPCSLKTNDTLYRVDYHDFWKSMDRPHLELYRGHPTIRTRRQLEAEQADEEEEDGGEILVLQPICMKKQGKCRTIQEARAEISGNPPSAAGRVNFQTPDYQRCREIPYSGEDILHRAPFGDIANGYR